MTYAPILQEVMSVTSDGVIQLDPVSNRKNLIFAVAERATNDEQLRWTCSSVSPLSIVGGACQF